MLDRLFRDRRRERLLQNPPDRGYGRFGAVEG